MREHGSGRVEALWRPGASPHRASRPRCGCIETVTTAAPAPADPVLLEAQRRAERLAAHGPTVRGVSVTATLAVISVLWTLLAAAPLLDGPWRFGPVLVAAVGAVIAVRAWVLARRRHTL